MHTKQLLKRAFILLLAFLMVFCPIVTALADGNADVNVDAGGGNMENVTGESKWHEGDEGVRISLYQVSTGRILQTADFSNIEPSITIFFGYTDKLEYMSGKDLTFDNGANYKTYVPENTLPTIISPNGNNNVQVLKSFFGDEVILRYLAGIFGIEFEEMITDDYKILMEPVAYFKYNGIMYAMSATEAALYNDWVNEKLRKAMGNLTHQNLPLAMFLEEDDLGITAWSGASTGYQTDSNILSYLGCGVISYFII